MIVEDGLVKIETTSNFKTVWLSLYKIVSLFQKYHDKKLKCKTVK